MSVVSLFDSENISAFAAAVVVVLYLLMIVSGKLFYMSVCWFSVMQP